MSCLKWGSNSRPSAGLLISCIVWIMRLTLYLLSYRGSTTYKRCSSDTNMRPIKVYKFCIKWIFSIFCARMILRFWILYLITKSFQSRVSNEFGCAAEFQILYLFTIFTPEFIICTALSHGQLYDCELTVVSSHSDVTSVFNRSLQEPCSVAWIDVLRLWFVILLRCGRLPFASQVG